LSIKTVNDPSPAYEEMEKDRELSRLLLYGGQRELREGGEKYLPKYEGERGAKGSPKTEYGGRLSRSVLVNFYKDAVQDLVGRIFQRPLVLSEDAPKFIEEFWRNVDNSGTHGDIFLQRVASDALGQGVNPVLVDFPQVGEEFENERAEERAGIRPRWVFVRADRNIEALADQVRGRDVLSRFRLRESETGVDGYEYGASLRVREFVMGDPAETSRDNDSEYYARWNLYEYVDDGDQWQLVESNQVMNPSRKATAEQKDLFVSPPIVAFYGERTGFFQGKTPLLTLADLNLQHYQKKSDLDNIERIANVPMLVLEGGTGAIESGGGNQEIGAYRLFEPPGGKTLKYLEITGSGIAHLKESLVHLEDHIRQVGKKPTVRKATGTEVATARLLDEAQTLTQAQAWAMQWVDAANLCLEYTAAWKGIAPPVVPWLKIEEDVLEALARPEAFQDVKDMYTQGALSTSAYVKEAKRYGVLDRDFDVDEDAELLQESPVLAGGEFGNEPDDEPEGENPFE
jgi:hypothetical protein